ncbi:TVP38/TMEM64 family protein [Pseudonocardia abyssalis]|uniref:TVP38/TMEM64 family membrane protein n=1 Tax=Pseudonocardia abyssalis TaxID=2792008 RepID=A0ABS6UQL7_9PSEU|nr:VTT domain-containing protein [Pseudonocardia abyssalis]MBW0116951.1 VTT domain-containing protein [Pseudonocardia abyssalis]MBW0134558.1 VTT domain-containing protein [Pseudonocardia abyssalis]
MRRWWKPALLAAIVVAAVVVALTVGVPPIPEVRAAVAGAGWAGPVLFAGLYAGLSLTPVPATVLSIAAGVLFGWAVGVPVVMAGAFTGAAIGFLLARHLGRTALDGVGGERLARLDAFLRRRGLVAVLVIRMVPILPFAVINMACGLSALRTRDYLVGSGLGMLPAVTAFVGIGAYGTEPGSLPFLVSAGGLALLLVGGAVLARRRRLA